MWIKFDEHLYNTDKISSIEMVLDENDKTSAIEDVWANLVFYNEYGEPIVTLEPDADDSQKECIDVIDGICHAIEIGQPVLNVSNNFFSCK